MALSRRTFSSLNPASLLNPSFIIHIRLPFYQPCFFNSITLLTAALNPVLNLALHR